MCPGKSVSRNVKIFTGAKSAVVENLPAMELQEEDLEEDPKERMEAGVKESNQKEYMMAVLLIK